MLKQIFLLLFFHWCSTNYCSEHQHQFSQSSRPISLDQSSPFDDLSAEQNRKIAAAETLLSLNGSSYKKIIVKASLNNIRELCDITPMNAGRITCLMSDIKANKGNIFTPHQRDAKNFICAPCTHKSVSELSHTTVGMVPYNPNIEFQLKKMMNAHPPSPPLSSSKLAKTVKPRAENSLVRPRFLCCPKNAQIAKSHR